MSIRLVGPFLPLVRGAVDLLFPPRCALCDGLPARPGLFLCGDCQVGIDNERRQPACPTCASNVAPFEVSEGLCRRCRRKRWSVRGAVRAGPYADCLGALLRAYKFNGRDELGPLLCGWLGDEVAGADWFDRIEAIVSVPTHWKHRLRRPFHAADALAEILAVRFGLPHVPVLRRVHAKKHQVGLSYKDRVENVRGAFALQRGTSLHKARILLIDDVKTTGATTTECAKVLRRGGATEVYVGAVLTVSDAGPNGHAISAG